MIVIILKLLNKNGKIFVKIIFKTTINKEKNFSLEMFLPIWKIHGTCHNYTIEMFLPDIINDGF